MKFSGNIYFIDIMIMSKFEVDYITLTNFRNVHIIENDIFWCAKMPEIRQKMFFFLQILFDLYIDIISKKSLIFVLAFEFFFEHIFFLCFVHV